MIVRRLPYLCSECRINMSDVRLPKVLAIDDEPQSLEFIKDALSGERLELHTANSADGAREVFGRIRPQIVLLDLVMPGIAGWGLLEEIVTKDPGVDVVLMTAHYSTESAVEAIQRGACDYLNKPLSLERFLRRISQLLGEAENRQRTMKLDQELLDVYQFEGIVGRSPLLLDVFAKIRRVAPHFRTALVTGATGTGKELVARALHRLGPVASNPFVVCNCSAIVETLLESELFGYVRGAFTGATQDKVGVFEYANRGTVFLDEIGDLPLAAQAKLLRVLQNQEVQRVGSPAPKTIDVRVIAATNHNLRTLIAEGKFREDLYYRLAMVEIPLPKLIDRREDLPLLQRYFLEKFSTEYKKQVTGITRRAQTLLSSYRWPGNVRELENVIGNACMMVDGPVIDIADLPQQLRSPASTSEQDESLISLDELQKRHLTRVLERVGGNKARAAEILGISRATVYELLAQMKSQGST
jgi:DNA-binding NtrC family response regulator